MKKLYIIGLVLGAGLWAGAQTYQATIKAGTTPNSVILAIKPSANAADVKLSSISLCIAVPAGANPKPVANIVNNFNPNIAYTPQVSAAPEMVTGKGNYHIYNFLGDGAQGPGTERAFTAGVDNNMIEVGFGGGPLSPNFEILLVNLPGGGSTAQTNFYIADKGTDVTNQTAMFYGTGAVNGPGGYDGLSFVNASEVNLPVKFLSFLALKNGDDARLTWTVENDTDNKMFEIERGFNARDFVKVATVDAARNGRNQNTYELTDSRLSNLNNKVIYYRVRQIDNNGEALYSPIRSINIDKAGSAVTLFPNPAKGVTKLVIDAAEAGKATILIRDMSGKLMKQINTQLFKGMNQQDLNVAAFASGEYNVTVMGTGYTHNIKLTKIN